MPREAKLFESAKGSPTRALFKLQGNIPPNWIARARGSRKSLEPDLVASMKKLQKLRKSRPNAQATIKAAEQELKMLLKLERSRTGKSPSTTACVRCSRSAETARPSAKNGRSIFASRAQSSRADSG